MQLRVPTYVVLWNRWKDFTIIAINYRVPTADLAMLWILISKGPTFLAGSGFSSEMVTQTKKLV
jgi:hypothetical protein